MYHIKCKRTHYWHFRDIVEVIRTLTKIKPTRKKGINIVKVSERMVQWIDFQAKMYTVRKSRRGYVIITNLFFYQRFVCFTNNNNNISTSFV